MCGVHVAALAFHKAPSVCRGGVFVCVCRYESGLDNSPMYDGDDNPPGEGQGVGPVRFNDTTSHMELYDVAFSVYVALSHFCAVSFFVPGLERHGCLTWWRVYSLCLDTMRVFLLVAR